MTARISVVGSLNMDLVIRAPRIPKPGETIIGGEFQTIPGGKGANQAMAAARLGAQVTMIGRVGVDPFADALLANLISAGIDTGFIERDEHAASGVALIVVDDDGENSIVVASGANMQMTLEDVEAAAGVITNSDVLLLQLEVPLPVVGWAAQMAHSHGVPVILNPAPAQKLPADLLKHVDVVVPNESEAAILTGLPVENRSGVELAGNKLLEAGARAVIITLGKQGALLIDEDRGSRTIDPFLIQAVDTTAAGDAFMAGFAVQYAAGKSLVEAARWGNAAGALAALRFGAQTSLPTEAEVLKLLAGEEPERIIGRQL